MNPPMKMTKANCSSKIIETRGNFEKMIQMHKKIFHRIKYTNQSPICCEIENLINDFIEGISEKKLEQEEDESEEDKYEVMDSEKGSKRL